VQYKEPFQVLTAGWLSPCSRAGGLGSVFFLSPLFRDCFPIFRPADLVRDIVFLFEDVFFFKLFRATSPLPDFCLHSVVIEPSRDLLAGKPYH